MGACLALSPLPHLKSLFLLFGCLVQPEYGGFCLALPCQPHFDLCGCCLLETCSLLKRKQKGCGSRDGGDEWVAARRSGGRGNWSWDVLYRRRIYFNKKHILPVSNPTVILGKKDVTYILIVLKCKVFFSSKIVNLYRPYIHM